MLTVSEVAERLFVSPRTVLRLIESGDLPAVRPGRRNFRLNPADVDRYIARRRFDSLVAAG